MLVKIDHAAITLKYNGKYYKKSAVHVSECCKTCDLKDVCLKDKYGLYELCCDIFRMYDCKDDRDSFNFKEVKDD